MEMNGDSFKGKIPLFFKLQFNIFYRYSKRSNQFFKICTEIVCTEVGAAVLFTIHEIAVKIFISFKKLKTVINDNYIF